MIQFRLDKNSFVPFYRQIVEMVLSGISAGTLLPGERLPTIRDMAVKLEINPNTVVKAYSQLRLLGVLDMQQGTGAFVRPNAADSISIEDKQKTIETLCRDFAGRAQLQNISIDDLIKCLKNMQEHP